MTDGLPQTTVNAILQDKKGFMYFGTKWGLARYDGSSFVTFKKERGNSHSIGNNFITCLYEDTTGKIWVGTDAGTYIYNPERNTFTPISEVTGNSGMMEHTVTAISGDRNGRIWLAVETEGLYSFDTASGILRNFKFEGINSNVQCFVADNSGRLWIGFYGSGLYHADSELTKLTPYTTPGERKEVFKDDVIMKIIPGAYNCLYISSIRNGIQKLNLTSGNLQRLLSTDESGESIFGRELLISSDDELWIGAESGIYIYNFHNNGFKHLTSSLNDSYSLSDNAIYSLYEDRDGGIWVGSYFGGIDFLASTDTYFEKHYPFSQDAGAKGLHGQRVREFCKDKNGLLWIGTEDGGLTRYNPTTKEFSFFEPSSSFSNIQGLCIVDDKLWVGTFSKGLKIIDTNTAQIVRTYTNDGKAGSLIDNSVFSICRTTTGDVLVGTMFGLLKYNKQTDSFECIKELTGKFIYDIREDSNGNLWLATYVNGAYCYDVSSRKWKNYMHDESNPESLASNKVLSTFEDSHGQIWLTTQGGGCSLYDAANDSFINYNSSNHLPTDIVYQMVEDNKGKLWLTSNTGLVKFDPELKQSKIYTTSNGLLDNQFNYKSSFKDKNGDIYLGSLDGFVVFNPDTFFEENTKPSLVITDFLLFNKEIYPYEKDSPLDKSITYSDQITLDANQNSFSLKIGSLNFQKLRKDRLMYRLDGFDSNWIELGESPIVTYSNLGHGDYKFRMKMINADTQENTEEYNLRIRILPPFYLSTWAYILYGIIIIAATILTVRYFRQRAERLRKQQLEKFEHEKETEIYIAKIDFFTSVAHEIRTPLTLIKGPLENILHNKNLDSETHDDLNIMRHNTDRLLNLTNQLLDFRKVESKGFSINFAKCDLTEIVRETYMRFMTVARQKNLDFTLNLPEYSIYAHINREAFTKILSNLLNNGVKYAATYLHVTLTVNQERQEFKIVTENDGTIIPLAVRDDIFKPFVRFNDKQSNQLTPGTGIGLALSRSLAELHNGSLEMNTSVENNCFILTMPIKQESVLEFDASNEATVTHEAIDEISGQDESDEPVTTVKKGESKERRHSILVVEDNDEVREFVRRQFAQHYQVFTACNGEEALAVLESKFVNLVVSDVVMPVMDGFELCRTIKSNIGYSHIPVVLLTAKTNVQSKIEGMELGADSYIEKPFSSSYLLAVVANLINSREKLRREFANSPYAEVSTMALSKADEEFIKKLDEIIQANLANQEFNIYDMADSFNMSRSSFYRKVQVVLDLTPKEYLRVERLKRAAQLLKSKEYRINEICYMVGFNTSSYFTKCFLKQFGVLPKDFV